MCVWWGVKSIPGWPRRGPPAAISGCVHPASLHTGLWCASSPWGKQSRQEETVNSKTPIIPLLTQHCWHLSVPLCPTADGAADRGYRGDREEAPAVRPPGCVAKTLPLQWLHWGGAGWLVKGSGCCRRPTGWLSCRVSIQQWFGSGRRDGVMGRMNRLWQFGGEKLLTQLWWSKLKGNGNEPNAAFGEMLMFILAPGLWMSIFI